jgi:acetylglutamate synthase
MEKSFSKKLNPDYFESTTIKAAYITQCYRAAAIITEQNGLAYLDNLSLPMKQKAKGWVRPYGK